MPLRLTVFTSVVRAGTQELGMKTLIFSNEEIEDAMEIVKSLEELSLMIKNVCKRTKCWV